MKFKNYMGIISGGMIGNSNYINNYIGTSLNGLIQVSKLKVINPIKFLQINFASTKMIERLIGLAIFISKN